MHAMVHACPYTYMWTHINKIINVEEAAVNPLLQKFELFMKPEILEYQTTGSQETRQQSDFNTMLQCWSLSLWPPGISKGIH